MIMHVGNVEKNYTEKETEMALTVIDRYRCIVDNKATDGASQKERNCAWQKIVQEYNATAVSAPRTKRKFLDQENEKFDVDNLEALKRRKTEDKKNRSKTGGGQYEAQLSEVEARVLAMVEVQAKPLPNIYDDDNIYHGGKYEIVI
ncbi:hypothetical protein MTP99_002308 [Tenebrio molitor]|nr:hypothetical protein MTP99_002308 [Tenebrio molitor]